MINEVMRSLIDAGKTKPQQLAVVAGVCTQTVYNWLGGQGQPTESAIRAWMLHHPSRSVRVAVLRELSGGRAVFRDEQQPLDLDVNGDGVVDLDDGLAATIKANGHLHTTLEVVYQSYADDPNSVSDEEWLRLTEEAAKVRELLNKLEAICTQGVNRRRPARPLPMARAGGAA